MPKIPDPNSVIAEIRRADLLALQARTALLEAKLKSAPNYLDVCRRVDELQRKLAEKESLPAQIVTAAAPVLRTTEVRREALAVRRRQLERALRNVEARGENTAKVRAQIAEIEQTLSALSSAERSNASLNEAEINELMMTLRGERNRAEQVGDTARVAECTAEMINLRRQRKERWGR